VSTIRQGKSGLGLEAQREAVQRFAAGRAGRIIAPEFIEVESGNRNDRPELENAIKRCRLTGATPVVAKLDRLSRNAAFLMALRDSGVEFVAADLPEANTMTVGVMALVAQHEREAIIARTKAALQAAKARGKKLGGRRPGAGNIARYQRRGVKAAMAKAAERLSLVADDLRKLSAEGPSLNAMAGRLNGMASAPPGGRSTLAGREGCTGATVATEASAATARYRAKRQAASVQALRAEHQCWTSRSQR
jgi:DNA invertase Pin-like site-specific DNA recombinase